MKQKHGTAGKRKLADGVCLIVALIWGSGFIANQYAIEARYSSTMIMAFRFVIASLVMLAVCAKKLRTINREYLRHGVTAGLLLFAAFFLQTYGQARTTVSHSAFLTATNVVMVPFLVWAATRKAPPLKIFILAAATLAGVGVLSLAPGEAAALRMGDGIILACAFFFALHIFYLGRAVKDKDPLLVNLIQISTAAAVSLLSLLLFDRGSPARADLSAGLLPVLFLGLMSTCLCYLLQTWAQKYTTATVAGILLSTEGLFGSLFSILLGMEPLTGRIVAGGCIILLSVIFMEAPVGRRRAGPSGNQ